MLTSDLLRVRTSRDGLIVGFVDDEDESLLALARDLIDLVTSSVGRSRDELTASLAERQGDGLEFLLPRGLTKLLLDRCEILTDCPVEPTVLRQDLFVRSALAWKSLDPEQAGAIDADALVAGVAAERGLDAESVRQGLFADLRGAQILRSFDPCTPEWLLAHYNVALAQGVLLRSQELEIRLAPAGAARHREFFRKIKFFRLLHRVKKSKDGTLVLTLDGPLSLFRSGQRYGLGMALFLPTLLHFSDWTLEARVQWGKTRTLKRFTLDCQCGLRPSGRLTGQWIPDELRVFPDDFSNLNSPWQVSTEGEVIDLGGQGVLIPDFVFSHPDGRVIPMEVLGYWRKGALETRLELLKRRGPREMIVAVSKDLATDPDALKDLPAEVHVFRSQPLPRKVLEILERMAPAPVKITRRLARRRRPAVAKGDPEPRIHPTSPREQFDSPATDQVDRDAPPNAAPTSSES